MNNLSLAVERRDDLYLEQLSEKGDHQDDIDSKIDVRAKELISNFSNEADWQIVELLKKKLESKSIDGEIYNQFITDICYSQARLEIVGEHKQIMKFGRY